MIAFLYPHNDYAAAELMTKVQALAASRGLQVYSPPRNFNMNAWHPDKVRTRLAQCSYGLFVARDVVVIDEHARQELQWLLEQHKEVFLIVPEQVRPALAALSVSPQNIFAYDPANPTDLTQVVSQLMARHHEASAVPQTQTAPAQKKGDGLRGFLLLVGLIALLIAAFKDE